jgi:hypothetical protein
MDSIHAPDPAYPVDLAAALQPLLAQQPSDEPMPGRAPEEEPPPMPGHAPIEDPPTPDQAPAVPPQEPPPGM